MKYKTITQRRKEQVKQLKRSERLLRRSRAIAIATILLCLMTCGGCSTQNSERIKENCLTNVVTYGDAVECAIKLNEVQK